MTLSLIEVIHSSYVMLGSNRCYSLPASALCWTVACSLKYSHSLSSPVCPPSFPPVLPVKANKLVVQKQKCRYCTAGKERQSSSCVELFWSLVGSRRERLFMWTMKNQDVLFSLVFPNHVAPLHLPSEINDLMKCLFSTWSVFITNTEQKLQVALNKNICQTL